jgi:hypothetical protein
MTPQGVRVLPLSSSRSQSWRSRLGTGATAPLRTHVVSRGVERSGTWFRVSRPPPHHTLYRRTSDEREAKGEAQAEEGQEDKSRRTEAVHRVRHQAACSGSSSSIKPNERRWHRRKRELYGDRPHELSCPCSSGDDAMEMRPPTSRRRTKTKRRTTTRRWRGEPPATARGGIGTDPAARNRT